MILTQRQCFALLYGPPGAGKTFTVAALAILLNMEEEIIWAASTGTASAQFNAPTINSLLKLQSNADSFESAYN